MYVSIALVCVCVCVLNWSACGHVCKYSASVCVCVLNWSACGHVCKFNSNLHLSDNGDPAPLFTALQYRSFAGTRSASGSRVIIGIGYLYSTC